MEDETNVSAVVYPILGCACLIRDQDTDSASCLSTGLSSWCVGETKGWGPGELPEEVALTSGPVALEH
ncbi:hypothetical protein ACOMHN_066780 [Nucella lapillus]